MTTTAVPTAAPAAPATPAGLPGCTAIPPRAARLDALAGALGHGLRAGAAWALGLTHQHQHSVLLVEERADGTLDAALPLVVDPPLRRVTTPGADLAHYAVVASRGDRSTAALADTLRRWASDSLDGYHLVVGPLLADGAAAALSRRLDGWATSSAAEPVPVLRRDTRDEAAAYLSPGTRRTLRKAVNRLGADGRHAQVSVLRTEDEVLEVLPALARVHRTRDEVRGVAGMLSTPEGAERWTGWLTGLTRVGRLEVTALTIDGGLASYVVAADDGDHYRVVEGVFDPDFARYAPGRLLEAAVLQRVLDRRDVQVLDWMTSVAPEALLAHNELTPTVVLTVG